PNPERDLRRDALPGRDRPGAGGPQARLLPESGVPEPQVPGPRHHGKARLPPRLNPRRGGRPGEQHAPPGDQGAGPRPRPDPDRPPLNGRPCTGRITAGGVRPCTGTWNSSNSATAAPG